MQRVIISHRFRLHRVNQEGFASLYNGPVGPGQDNERWYRRRLPLEVLGALCRRGHSPKDEDDIPSSNLSRCPTRREFACYSARILLSDRVSNHLRLEAGIGSLFPLSLSLQPILIHTRTFPRLEEANFPYSPTCRPWLSRTGLQTQSYLEIDQNLLALTSTPYIEKMHCL